MNSLELVNALYKPYRITKRGASTIIEAMDGKFVVKPKGKQNVKELFNYLKIRNFENFPTIVDGSRDDINIFEYVEDTPYPKDQKGIDLIRTVADLHLKTSYSKEVREDKYKEIYDTLNGNLAFYKEKYAALQDEIEEHIFMSPSEYLFIRNSSKLFSQISFCEDKVNEWYDLVKDKRETRVSVVHNNLSIDHFLKSKKSALISWDASSVDSPIIDFYKFYDKEALNLEFSSILKEYFKQMDLHEDERALLLILLCMPKDIDFSDNEFHSCETISSFYDLLYRTEWLVRPYYSVDDEEK